ncbi:hypothetical protein KJ742_02320 [Patescibacteria group bacterium]|nr:hypothetical protein [Patescibacteria group bacterium]MBU1682756.1 hypothetical protein [Patescibacteria group bacterium]
MEGKLIKKILKIILKLFLIGISIFVLLIIIGSTVMNWPKFFHDRDKWPRDMVKQCNGNFENCIVSADEVTDFDWDKMYIFREAVSNELVEEILNFQYNVDSSEGSKRRIIFVKNNQVVHKELNFYNPWEGAPDKAVFFEYDEGEAHYYISRNKENAVFKVTSSDETEGKIYYFLTPVSEE